LRQQTISGLVAGQTYTLTFYAAQRAGYFNSSTYQELTVTMGSTILVGNLKPSSTNYQQYSYTFTPTSSDNQTLTFTGLEPTHGGVECCSKVARFACIPRDLRTSSDALGWA
jgi:hypothetical protein